MLFYFVPILTISLFALIWIIYIEFRLRKFFRGENGKNLEKILSDIALSLGRAEKRLITLEEKLEINEKKLKNCIQRTTLLRFNPFQDTGGNQSFSLAMLDEEKNGLVISSLYGREINRIYAKPIKAGASEYQLTEEEKEAIKKAG